MSVLHDLIREMPMHGRISGDFSPGDIAALKLVAKEFGDELKERTKQNGIPISNAAVFAATFLIIAKDTENVFYIFANNGGTEKLLFQDLANHGSIELDDLVANVKLEVGEPILTMHYPLEILSNEKLKDDCIREAVSQYVGRLIIIMSQLFDNDFCFVIMSFSNNPQLQDFYEMGVKPTVEELGYRCERVDEQDFNGSIKQKIIDNIKKAKFIIADVTEARPNCYYELGIAHALEKPVIHITNNTSDIHFDITDFNFIVYKRVGELKEKLEKRITNTIK